MTRSERGREGGFSLIEIILVIMLIGIISAVAIVRFPEFPKTGAVARNLVSDIRYAKQLANRLQDTGGNPCCGIFFISSTQYRVFTNNNTSTAATDPHTGTAMEATMTGKYSGVTLSQTFTNSILKFNSLGTPYQGSGSGTALGAAATITVSGAGGDRPVTVEPNTGKVTGP